MEMLHHCVSECVCVCVHVSVGRCMSNWIVWGTNTRLKPTMSCISKLSLHVRSCCCTVRILRSCCHGDVAHGTDVRVQPGSSIGSGDQTAPAGEGSELQLNVGQQDSPELRQQLTAKKGSKVFWGGVWSGEVKKTGWGIPLPQGLLEQNQCSVWHSKLNLDFMVRTCKHNQKLLYLYGLNSFCGTGLTGLFLYSTINALRESLL